MRNAKTVLFLGFGLLQAQQLEVMSPVSTMANGVGVIYRSVVEPADGPAGPRLSGGVITNKAIHRYVQAADSSFGYDLSASPVNGGRDIRIRIEPLTMTPEAISRLSGKNLRVAQLTKYPAAMTVRSGSTIEVEILRNAATGQRVVDLLTLTVNPARAAANWELRLVEPVATAGKLSTSTPATLTGDVVSLQVPRQGTLTLSLLAMRSRGFQLVGEVDGNVMRFEWRGEKFEIVSKESVVPGGGRWNLYARLTPRDSGNEMVIGTSDL